MNSALPPSCSPFPPPSFQFRFSNFALVQGSAALGTFHSPITRFLSHSYKLPLPQLLSFHTLANARGCTPLPNFRGPILDFRVSHFGICPLSPFPATLTRNQYFCRKTAPVSPLFATLTKTWGMCPSLSFIEDQRETARTAT